MKKFIAVIVVDIVLGLLGLLGGISILILSKGNYIYILTGSSLLLLNVYIITINVYIYLKKHKDMEE